MPLESIIEFISTLMTDYLYVGVFLAALIETVIPPIPTMAVFQQLDLLWGAMELIVHIQLVEDE